MFGQQLLQDHGHAGRLKNASATMSVQRLQGGAQHQFVADPVRAAMFATDTVQYAVNALALPKAQERRLVQ